ncbi:uncharacterized protein LOC110022347 [Phalaenopsis equestris]|uniref:uncharacterized protein LOC110022347 n=1 Tax=Phalaenopsis equestris TaxID=78828 RepID=UPI0009E18BC3|nr:uncharacterized protein LOC110022347 [Phalaenopsis equestris]
MASSSWSLEIAGGGSKPVLTGRDFRQKPRYRFSSLQLNTPLRRRPASSVRALESHSNSCVLPVKFDSLTCSTARGSDGRDRITVQKLDDWMRGSIGEIVRNIGKAPFLARVFSDESESKRAGSSSSGLMIEEAATAEGWLGIKQRWEQESSVPDGVILVEELDSKEEDEGEGGRGGRSNVRWGVVVQGRGLDCSACYILNTCRVRSSMGFCTHFCLVRAQCFGDPVGVQLKNVWLQNER